MMKRMTYGYTIFKFQKNASSDSKKIFGVLVRGQAVQTRRFFMTAANDMEMIRLILNFIQAVKMNDTWISANWSFHSLIITPIILTHYCRRKILTKEWDLNG